MSSRNTTYLLPILIAMVGLIAGGPTIAFCKSAERWNIRIESYNLDNSHIAGDTFRVEVRFTNRSPGWMHSVTTKIIYPEGVEPIMEHFCQRVVSRFPWKGHFIDFDNRFIRFTFSDSIAHSEEKFFAFFTATKYGKMNFDYEIRWLGTDSLVYKQTRKGQTVFFNESKESDIVQKSDTSTLESDIVQESDTSTFSGATTPPENNGNEFTKMDDENGEKIRFLSLLLVLLLFFVLYIRLWRIERKHYRKLKNSIDILVETQKKLVSIEIERSKTQKNDEDENAKK